MSGISRLPNIHIRNAIQQLQDVEESEISVQILNNAIEECKLDITTVANQGGGEVRRCGDFAEEYGRELIKANGMNSVNKCGRYITIWPRKSNALCPG